MTFLLLGLFAPWVVRFIMTWDLCILFLGCPEPSVGLEHGKEMPGKFCWLLQNTIMNTVLHTQNIVEIRHVTHFTGNKKQYRNWERPQLNYIYQNPLYLLQKF